MQNLVLDRAAQAVIDAVDKPKQTQHWLIVVEGDVEPELRGPYPNDDARLQAARKIHDDCSEDDWPGLFRLDIQGVIHSVEVDSFAGGEMWGDDDSEDGFPALQVD
jgi:hypothetical protein